MLTGRTPVFTLERVSVERGGVVLLGAVSCEIAAGACPPLVGPSGAGKTTLLRLLNRLEEPSSGTVCFHGRPLPARDVLGLRSAVALVGQQPVLLTETVRDDLSAARLAERALFDDAHRLRPLTPEASKATR